MSAILPFYQKKHPNLVAFLSGLESITLDVTIMRFTMVYFEIKNAKSNIG